MLRACKSPTPGQPTADRQKQMARRRAGARRQHILRLDTKGLRFVLETVDVIMSSLQCTGLGKVAAETPRQAYLATRMLCCRSRHQTVKSPPLEALRNREHLSGHGD